MATKNRPRATARSGRDTAASSRRSTPVKPDRTKLYLGGAGVVVAAVVGLMMVVALTTGAFNSGASSGTTGESVVKIAEGSYTNVTAAHLADMLENKDFTFVNVKTPYIGEIDKTDLYIPYDQLAARASELPQTRTAKILVYCRSGVESLAAVKTLLGLGYTNVWNLDGGMNAWTANGGTLINKAR